jgi:hypothetical protein
MKKMLSGLLAGAVLMSIWAVAEAGPFTRREARQQARIYQGVRSGAITPGEYHRLQREQAHIEADRRRAWADGILTPWEGRHLTAEQNRASRHIYRAKHNPAVIY